MAALDWDRHARWATQVRRTDGDAVVLTYEDTVGRPYEALRGILRLVHADQRFVEQMLSELPASTASLHKWKSRLSADEVLTLESVCFLSMSGFEYVPELATASRNVGVIRRSLETAWGNAHRVPFDPRIWRRKKLLKRFWAAVKR